MQKAVIAQPAQIVGHPTLSTGWDKYREIVEQLYVEEDKSLPTVIEELKRIHGFSATERQYKRKISEWHLDKNVKDDEMRAIIATQESRLREGKQSSFFIRGRQVDPLKIRRFVRRKKIDLAISVNDCCSLPSDVKCITPPADIVRVSDAGASQQTWIASSKRKRKRNRRGESEKCSDASWSKPQQALGGDEPAICKDSSEISYVEDRAKIQAPEFYEIRVFGKPVESGHQDSPSKFNQTTSDIYKDELYHPRSTPSDSSQFPKRSAPQEKLLPPRKSLILDERLEEAPKESTSSDTALPLNSQAQGQLSIVLDSSYHVAPSLRSASNFEAQLDAPSVAVQMRREHSLGHPLTLGDPVTPKIISLKETRLEQVEKEQEIDLSLFHHSKHQNTAMCLDTFMKQSDSQSDGTERCEALQPENDRPKHTRRRIETRMLGRAQTFLLQDGNMLLDEGLPDEDLHTEAISLMPTPELHLLELWRRSSLCPPTSYDRNGYYAKPILVYLSSLPSTIRQRPVDAFYFHFFMDETARLLAPHENRNNGFHHILPRMALRNDSLLALLLAYSASHRANLLGYPQPRRRIASWIAGSIFNFQRALKGIVSHTGLSIDDFATVMMLASLDIMSPNSLSIHISWQDHLLAAKSIYKWLSNSFDTGELLQAEEVREQAFLNRWYRRIVTMGALSAPETNSSLNLVPSDPGELLTTIEAKNSGRYHTAEELLDTLHASAELIKRHEREENESHTTSKESSEGAVRPTHVPLPTTPVVDRCLLYALKTCDLKSAKAWSDGMEGTAIQKLYGCAAAILLYRRVEGLRRSDHKVQICVKGIFDTLGYADLEWITPVILFPLFIAGCEACELVQRDVTSRVFDRLEKLGMAHITAARQLMEKVWETDKPWWKLSTGEYLGHP